MPISLKSIETKLHNQDFATLAELESYFKRMVMNAKEFYHKGSDVFEDAERVRKALSNYMTKTNPAYKMIHGYSCQAAPIPDDHEPPVEEHARDEDADAEAESKDEGKDEDAEGEDDAEGEEEEEEEEDEDEEDEDDEDNSRSRNRIILKRKGPGRPPRHGSRSKPDHEYEGVPYKGLTFQQAQEKIVEELIRKPDGSYDYPCPSIESREAQELTPLRDPYFFDFINLPARTYKEYFAVITSPLSLKGLQKQVKGIRGRAPATGLSDFKGWAAFEERASLLWENAHYYNEEGSSIYQLATELKVR